MVATEKRLEAATSQSRKSGESNEDKNNAPAIVSVRQLPNWCDPSQNLPEEEDEFALSEHEKEKLAEDPTFVYPLPNPMPPAKYWSDRTVTEVIIDEVENPDDFYMRNAETSKELTALENAMYEYYQANWKVSKILEMSDIIIDGYYAVYSFETGWWHRGRIISAVRREDGRRPDELLVFLVDHGQTDIVTLECVYFLRHHYVQLPIQATWASLDVPGIELVKQWDKKTIKSFENDVHSPKGEDIEEKRFGAIIRKIGHSSQKHMARVKVVLTERVDGKEKVYNFGDLLEVEFVSKKETDD